LPDITYDGLYSSGFRGESLPKTTTLKAYLIAEYKHAVLLELEDASD
jgi:hypothetical protein